MYLYAVPHDIGKCASVGEERKSPVRDESQEHPSPAVTVPRQRRHLSKRCPAAPASSSPLPPLPLRCVPSPSPPRRTRDVMPSRSETDSSVLAWTGRCSGSSSGAQPKSPLFSGGLWKTDRQTEEYQWAAEGWRISFAVSK